MSCGTLMRRTSITNIWTHSMDDFLKHHIERIKSATINRMSRKDIAQWITANTTIGGEPFSFVDHEYQLKILLDESDEIVIRKSAQTGISEISMRRALALLMLMPGSFRIGYTFPSASFAMTYSKSRLNPIIEGSPALTAAMSTKDFDSSELKTFGPGKELYFKGAAVGNAAISTTLDMLIHDELSFSDPDIIGDYWSRVQHSKYKWRTSLSTPTFVGDSVDTAFANSRRHWNHCKCTHCNHWFVPSYEMVAVPDWGKGEDLYLINKDNIHTTRYREAQMLCPKCAKPVDLSPENREWVIENPKENHNAAGYQVQPFDAPKIVTIPDLINASTKYNSKAKFTQFALGLPATDSDNGLTESDMERMAVEMLHTPFGSHIMGVDLGLYCHFSIGGVAQTGELVIVHYERVLLKNFKRRYAELVSEYNVTIKVSDVQPYTEMIMALSEVDPRLFAGRYITKTGLEIYDMKVQDSDVENALEGIREIVINRNGLFDKLLSLARPDDGQEPRIKIRKLTDWEIYKEHVTGMKRAKGQLKNGEFNSVWQKPANGNDHFAHSLGYCWVAMQLRGVTLGSSAGVGMSLTSFKLKGDTPAPGSPGWARYGAGGNTISRA